MLHNDTQYMGDVTALQKYILEVSIKNFFMSNVYVEGYYKLLRDDFLQVEEFLFGVSMKLIIISSIPSPYSSIRSTKGFPHIFPSTGENMFYAQTQALGTGHYASVFYKTTLLKSV